MRYVVRPGDNLFRLATTYFIRRDDYIVVQRLNRVADPYRLPIGMVLTIPRRLLRSEPVRGTVSSLTGSVRVDGQAASVGTVVSEGMLVETGQKSFVTFTLPDATAIALPSQSAVRVQRLRKLVLGSHVERLFGIERGRASATVTPMTDSLSDFRFATPRAVTSVRGTTFRMAYDDAAQLSTSEVLEGKVGFDADGQAQQALPAGYGTSSVLDAPVELLPPPQFDETSRRQTAEGVRLAFAPVPGASRYHVQVGTDAGFKTVLDEAFPEVPEARFAALPDGSYFVRATAIDANALEGEPGVYPFERWLDRMRLGLDMGWAGPLRQYLFWWDTPGAGNAQYRFQLAKAGREEKPMVDLPGLTGHSQAVIDLPRGRYRWRVMTSRIVGGQPVDEWSAYNDLKVENR